jgi:hypothetical protein
MLGNYRVAAQLVGSRMVPSSTKLVSYFIMILRVVYFDIYIYICTRICTYPLEEPRSDISGLRSRYTERQTHSFNVLAMRFAIDYFLASRVNDLRAANVWWL